MPQLSELIVKKKFVKKEYRPWDLSGNGTVDGKNKHDIPPVKNDDSPVAEQMVIEKNTTAVVANTDCVTGNNSDNNQVTSKQQLDNIKITREKQRDNNKITLREQRDNIIGNVSDNIEGQPYLIETIKKLTGIQKNIFYYVINICSARNALDTGNILSSDLAISSNCTVGSAKTSLIRLIEKHLILRLQGKACRGGHMVLGITNEIQAAAIQAQQALFSPFKVMRTDNIIGNTTGNIASYSSSIYKNNITTSLPEEWKKINFDLLEHIGFSETQLHQLCNTGMTSPEIVQDAINRFAYSLEHSDKVKAYGDPLNVLMGVLRKGQRWNEPNYVSPKELALHQLLEEKRKSKEKYDLMVKELIDIEFPEWRKKLSDDEIKQIVPAEILKMNMFAPIQSVLRTYFIKSVLSNRFEIEAETIE